MFDNITLTLEDDLLLKLFLQSRQEGVDFDYYVATLLRQAAERALNEVETEEAAE